MAKIKGLKEFEKSFNQALNTATNNINMLRMGDFAADLIRKRTRLGYGVDQEGGNKKKLAPLSKNYVKARKNKRISGATSPNKSNLTLTGEMLDDIQTIKASAGSATIGFKDSKNRDKAGYNTEGSKNRPPRPFFNLSKQEYLQLKDYVETILNKLLQKLE